MQTCNTSAQIKQIGNLKTIPLWDPENASAEQPVFAEQIENGFLKPQTCRWFSDSTPPNPHSCPTAACGCQGCETLMRCYLEANAWASGSSIIKAEIAHSHPFLWYTIAPEQRGQETSSIAGHPTCLLQFFHSSRCQPCCPCSTDWHIVRWAGRRKESWTRTKEIEIHVEYPKEWFSEGMGTPRLRQYHGHWSIEFLFGDWDWLWEDRSRREIGVAHAF